MKWPETRQVALCAAEFTHKHVAGIARVSVRGHATRASASSAPRALPGNSEPFILHLQVEEPLDFWAQQLLGRLHSADWLFDSLLCTLPAGAALYTRNSRSARGWRVPEDSGAILRLSGRMKGSDSAHSLQTSGVALN